MKRIIPAAIIRGMAAPTCAKVHSENLRPVLKEPTSAVLKFRK